VSASESGIDAGLIESSSRTDLSCVECEEGEVEGITAYKCPSCEALHEEEDEARNCCAEVEGA
jgi:hypothetical protein